MKISRLFDAACASVLCLYLSSADAGTIFANTGNGSLMSFDTDTLLQTGGASLAAVSTGQDLTFDNSGRLFGQLYDGSNNLVEYDPTTLSIINQTSLAGGRTTGLAAWNGSLFALTGNGSLMSFDTNTLLQTGGASLAAVSTGQDLTFDNSGRLFGQFYDGNNNLVEYDPTTLSIINQTSLAGGRTTGLAAVSVVPLPSAVWLFSTGLLGLIGISKRKKTT